MSMTSEEKDFQTIVRESLDALEEERRQPFKGYQLLIPYWCLRLFMAEEEIDSEAQARMDFFRSLDRNHAKMHKVEFYLEDDTSITLTREDVYGEEGEQ